MSTNSIALGIPSLGAVRRDWLGRWRERRATIQVADLAAALRPPVQRICEEATPFELPAGAKLHHDLLSAFGAAIGAPFCPTPIEPVPDGRWLHVRGILGHRPRSPDIGLRLERRDAGIEQPQLVASIDDLYLPRHALRCGAGTALIGALFALWSRLGIAEVKATASRDGSCSFASWGFELDRDNRLTLPAVRAELLARSGLDDSPNPPSPPPPELAEQLRQLLEVGPLAALALDIGAIYALSCVDQPRYGANLLHGVMWPARRPLGPHCAA